MSMKQEDWASKLDKIKWVSAVTLLLLGLVGNYYFLQIPVSLRALGWVVLCCIIAAILFQTVAGRQFWKFFREAQNEIKKVVWPTRQETMQTTLLVVAVVVVFALILWGVDTVLLWARAWLAR